MEEDLAVFMQAKRFGALQTLLSTFEEMFCPLFFRALSQTTQRQCLAVARGLHKNGLSTAAHDVLSFISFSQNSEKGPATAPGRRKRARESEADASNCHFYLRPPCVEPQLFVRVIASRGGVRQHFGAEEINRFFARYGFVGCQKLSDSSNEFIDFCVSVDSIANAVAAVIEVDNPEIPFVAFSSQSKNTHSVGDLPQLGQYVESVLSGLLVGESESTTNDEFRTPRRTPRTDPTRTDSHRKVLEAFAREHATLSELSMTPAGQLTDAPSWIDQYVADGGFVPEIVVEEIPCWTTLDQIREHCSRFGRVKKVRLSVHDRCGVFLGAAVVEMFSMAEALRLCEGLHGQVLDGSSLICGVLTRDLRIVSLANENDVRRAGSSILGTPELDLHERRWL